MAFNQRLLILNQRIDLFNQRSKGYRALDV